MAESTNVFAAPCWITDAQEHLWINPKRSSTRGALSAAPVALSDVEEAEALLHRFAPLIAKLFSETASNQGIIESSLDAIPQFHGAYASQLKGTLLLKRDDSLPLVGSIKARGGIYEVLHYAEQIALEQGILDEEFDDHLKLATDKARACFAQYSVQVGSTGNLGLSIGIMSAALGFQSTVHMSSDAWQWKKDLLRSKGCKVMEYSGDYGEACEAGRVTCANDPLSYFVDDESSPLLFLGYATVAFRLKAQLEERGIAVDKEHPLFVYLPCGVGSAPGGIAFGLKCLFGDAVHCFIAEPTTCPSVTLGLLSGKYDQISVYDVGLSGVTSADGLACATPSKYTLRIIDPLISGSFTVDDSTLPVMLKALWESENLFIEPSSCTALACVHRFVEVMESYPAEGFAWENVTHIAWATGGSFVPQSVRDSLLGASSAFESDSQE